jgi:hypothetical protein
MRARARSRCGSIADRPSRRLFGLTRVPCERLEPCRADVMQERKARRGLARAALHFRSRNVLATSSARYGGISLTRRKKVWSLSPLESRAEIFACSLAVRDNVRKNRTPRIFVSHSGDVCLWRRRGVTVTPVALANPPRGGDAKPPVRKSDSGVAGVRSRCSRRPVVVTPRFCALPMRATCLGNNTHGVRL